MNLTKIVVAGFGVIAFGNSYAGVEAHYFVPHWALVSTSPDGMIESYVDNDSVAIQGNFRLFWEKVIFHAPQKGVNIDPNKWLAAIVRRTTANCNTGADKSDEIQFFYDDGTFEDLPVPAADWAVFPSDSPVGQIIKFACAKK